MGFCRIHILFIHHNFKEFVAFKGHILHAFLLFRLNEIFTFLYCFPRKWIISNFETDFVWKFQFSKLLLKSSGSILITNEQTLFPTFFLKHFDEYSNYLHIIFNLKQSITHWIFIGCLLNACLCMNMPPIRHTIRYIYS